MSDPGRDEPGRLAALERYAVLDTPAEAEFDDLTQLASQICRTPIALISLVDGSRQWFKSRVGLEVCETPRELSFCQHTIQGPDLLEIPDATEDERFRANPLVTGEPKVRFYAGAPLTTPDGHRLGTLCVIDHTPRELSEAQRDGLRRLARQVVRQFEMRLDRARIIENAEALREGNERTEQIIASALDAIVTMGIDGRIVSWNPQAETIFGWSAGEVIGRKMSEVIIPPACREAHERGLRHLAETGEAKVLDRRMEMSALNKDGGQFPIELTISQVRVAGQTFFSGFIRDLTVVKEAEAKLQRAGDLLSAVSRLQSGYISRDQIEAVETFDALLELLLRFTDSEYGFAAEVLHNEEGQPYLKTHAITNIAWNEETQALYEERKAAGLEFHNLNTLFGAALVTGEPVISNSPSTDTRRGGLPAGHPSLDAFLGVPIKQNGELIAMVGVSNRPGGYDRALVEEIEPLLATYATIIRGFQFAKQRQADQQRIEALNVDLEARASELEEAWKENRRVERERLETLREHSANLERRVSERTAEVEHSRRQFQDLFEFAPDALVMTDQEGAIRLANRRAEQIFGWARMELTGKPVEALLPSALELESLWDHERLLRARGRSSQLGRRKDGTEFPVEMSLGPVQMEGGTLTVISMRDVSERKQLEREVARISSHEQERLSHELHDHLGAYLAGIAFRVKTLAEKLERHSLPEADAARQLTGQVNDGIELVRNFARLLAPVDLEAGGLAAGLSQMGREMETVFGIVCRVEVGPELPPLTPEESLQLYRIAQEATRNAVQHGSARQVAISIQCETGHLIQTVANDGEPWDPELERGEGLGLRIMRYRAAMIGGTLTIRSDSAKRTAVICRLPVPCAGADRESKISSP